MKKVLVLTAAFIVHIYDSGAQVFQVDTLVYNGSSNKYINIVVLGDGYTSSEQNTFIADVNSLTSYLFGEVPWINYAGYFNVFAIRVISSQSGVKHPNTSSSCSSASPLVPVSNPTTHLGCTFDAYGIHRLVVPQNISNIASVLSANFPNYDQVLVIANSPYYGGSGGTNATSTRAVSSNEITAHEIGHSFSSLSDEYYAGDVYAAEKPNMTQQANPSIVKWKNWIGYSGIGVYQHCCGGNSASWYRPHNNCKMRNLGAPYCGVCKEAIIESIHSLVNPVVSYTPSASTISSPGQFIDFKLTELMKPVPNTLNIKWTLDGADISANIDSLQLDQNALSNGPHTLVVSVVDTSSMLRVNNHSVVHVSTVTWTINKTSAGIVSTHTDNKITCSIYPNPASDVLNISMDLEKKSHVSIELVSFDGKVIRQITNKVFSKGVYLNTINVESISSGAYRVVWRVGSFIHSETVVKQ